MVDEMLQRAAHRLQLADFPVERSQVLLRDATHVRARTPAVVPEREQLLNLLHREPEVARPPDESQRVDVGVGIEPVACHRPARLFQQPERLVVPDHLGRHPGANRRLANVV